MSYKTEYFLSYEDMDGNWAIPEQEIAKTLYNIINGEDEAVRYIEGINDIYEFSEPCSWRDCSKNLNELSRRFPSILFTLKGYGESREDIWVNYYRDGDSFYAKAWLVFQDPPEDFYNKNDGEE